LGLGLRLIHSPVTAGLWPVGGLQRSRHILLQARREQRKFPLFLLNDGRSAQRGPDPIIRAHGSILDRASIRDEFVVNFDVPVTDLNGIFRRQPMAAPRLNCRSIAAHPIAHQKTSIGVETVIVIVPINITARHMASHCIRQRRFHAQVEFCDSRIVREVKPRTESSAARGCKGRRIIGGNGIGVYGQSFSQVRNAMAEVETAVTFSRVLRAGFDLIARRAEISQ
jgi:hypothetical protein